ncbi:MAG: hypothetical protein M3220_13325 [Chloroflexota bacterium]|nr:hypothetical protein [Chloroflexota bacterium]
MNQQTPTAELLAEGIAAARAGETIEAQRLLRRVTEEDPTNVQAWIWRADVAENNADKKAYLEEALALDPSNMEAQLALQRIIRQEGDLAARADDEILYCTVHPDRETVLRCNRCGRPMCTDCAVRHPVGLRCRNCVQETRSPIYQINTATVGRALIAATVISTVVGGLVLIFGGAIWWIFWLFIGGAIGRGIGEVVQRAVPRKRGRQLQIATGVGMVLGLLVAAGGLGFLQAGAPGIIAGMLRYPFQLHVLLYLGTALGGAVTALR